ncbi:MAG: helix-turn-helix transcriptional regulator [Pirellulales bacterium]|nr:helix-turn-helix transcriptional regulator [Pirellulales bacterium]
MNDMTQAKYKKRAKIFKAMAHPSRLLIIDELSISGERCVCELTDMVRTDTSTVSCDLAQLRDAGLVIDERRGSMVYYRLGVSCILDFFECVEAAMISKTECKPRLLN